MLLPCYSEAYWLLHIYLFLQLAVEEGRLDIHVMDVPPRTCGQGQQESHGLESSHRSEYLVVVDPVLLYVALRHEASLVLKNRALRVLLHLVHPLQADRAVTWW